MDLRKLLAAILLLAPACSYNAIKATFADDGSEHLAFLLHDGVGDVACKRDSSRTFMEGCSEIVEEDARFELKLARAGGHDIEDEETLVEDLHGYPPLHVNGGFYYMRSKGYFLINGTYLQIVRMDGSVQKIDSVSKPTWGYAYPSRDGSLIAYVGHEEDNNLVAQFVDADTLELIGTVTYPVRSPAQYRWDNDQRFYVRALDSTVGWGARVGETPEQRTMTACFNSPTSSSPLRKDGRALGAEYPTNYAENPDHFYGNDLDQDLPDIGYVSTPCPLEGPGGTPEYPQTHDHCAVREYPTMQLGTGRGGTFERPLRDGEELEMARSPEGACYLPIALFTNGLDGNQLQIQYELTDLEPAPRGRTIIQSETVINLRISGKFDGTCTQGDVRAFVLNAKDSEDSRVQVKMTVTDRFGASLSSAVTVIAKWPRFIDGLPREQFCGL